MALGIMLLGGMVHGLTGFGGALITMPVLALLFGPVEALALSAPAWVLGSLQMLPRASREVDWTALWPILIPALLATPLGTLLLFVMEPDIVRRTIGLFVLAGAVMLATGWTSRGRCAAASPDFPGWAVRPSSSTSWPGRTLRQCSGQASLSSSDSWAS